MENQEQELFERCIQLEGKKFELEDKIEDILDYLVKTHITLEEMEELEMMIY